MNAWEVPITSTKRQKPGHGAPPEAAGAGRANPGWAAPWMPVVIVFAVAFGLYANTLGHDFVWDDQSLIVQNPAAHRLDLGTPGRALTEPFVSVGGLGTAYYRPLVTMSFATDYALMGGRPLAFHLTNVTWNALTCVMVFLTLQLLFANRAMSLLAALLFAAHPVHTEAVAWIAGRGDIFATAGMLAGLATYVLARRRGSAILLAVSLSSYALALLAKESAAALPLLIAALEVTPLSRVVGGPDRSVRGALARVGLFVAVLAAYLWLRYQALGTITSDHPGHAGGVVGAVGLPLSIIAGYVPKLLLPLSLNAEYDAAIPATLMDPHVLAGAAVVAVVAGGFFWFRRQPSVVFALAVLVAGLLPVLNLVPIGDISAERFLYLPSLGIVVIVARILSPWLTSPSAGAALRPAPRWAWIGVVILLVAGAGRTLARNGDWSDERTLFTKTVAQAPESPRVHAALAVAAGRDGDEDLEIREYRRALEIDPDYYVALIGLSSAYFERGAFEEAIPLVEAALRQTPDDVRLIKNLAVLYTRTGQAERAAATLDRARALEASGRVGRSP